MSIIETENEINWQNRINKSKNNEFAIFLEHSLKNIKIGKCQLSQDGFKIGENGVELKLEILELSDGFEFINSNSERKIKCDNFKEAIKLLIDNVIDYCGNNKLKFFNLVVPKNSVEYANIEKCGNVLSRYMIDYLPMNYFLGQRWSIMIGRDIDVIVETSVK